MFRGSFIPAYDDGSFYGGGRSPYRGGAYGPYTPVSASRAYEEQRRRREIEAYQRAKQQELRRQQEIQRQRELEALRRKKDQEQQQEYMRRVQAEADRQEKLRQQQRRQQQQQQQQRYSIVRGPDGRLYRVPVDHDDDNKNEQESRPTIRRQQQQNQKRNSSPSFLRGPDGRVYRVQEDSKDYDDDESMYHTADEASVETMRRGNSPNKSKPRVEVNVTTNSAADSRIDVHVSSDDEMMDADDDATRRRVTVIVEDVPEDEMEEDDIKSYWRNRRPGPGESWMEPIAA